MFCSSFQASLCRDGSGLGSDPVWTLLTKSPTLCFDSFYRYISPERPVFEFICYGIPTRAGIQEAGVTPVKISGNILPHSRAAASGCVNPPTRCNKRHAHLGQMLWCHREVLGQIPPSNLAHSSCWRQRDLHVRHEHLRFPTVASPILLIHPWLTLLQTGAISPKWIYSCPKHTRFTFKT